MRAAFLLPLALTACTGVHLPAAEQASFDPVRFFTGRTYGTGTLHILASSASPIAVESVGVPTPDGLLLTQVIHEGGKPARTRQWRMTRLAPNRYTGTLTDAEGAVSLTIRGPRATIRYRMKNGMIVDQQLALQADERTLINHLEVRRWGVRVAWLDETIRKLR